MQQIFLSYTCSMREALKNVFVKEIVLEDGTIYYYTIQAHEVKNMLGQIVAVLDEYSFTEKGALKFTSYIGQMTVIGMK